MGFRRQAEPSEVLEGDRLTAAMVGIGMLFQAKPILNQPIEDVLYFASREGMERDDLRVLRVLTTWFGVHARWVHVNRLLRLLDQVGSKRIRVYWAALGQSQRRHDRRYGALASLHPREERVDLLPAGTSFLVERDGEHPRFANTCLRVPAKTLQERPADVMAPDQLAKMHTTYRVRVEQGPSYRADMWAELQCNPNLTAAELARRTYGSFETARLVTRDWTLLHPSAA